MSNITDHDPDFRTYQEGEVLKTSNLFGIEVELEDVNLGLNFKRNKGGKYWSIKSDDSLRGPHAFEFVTKLPLSGMDLEKALAEFKKEIISANPSSRCSVHIHIDVRAWTIEHFRSFVLHYLALERLLVKVSGNREENIFCWPFYRSGTKELLADAISRSKKKVSMLNNLLSKYTGLNFISIHDLGSLEVRIHKGEVETSAILRWLQILSCLVEYTRQEHQHIEDLPEFYSGNGPIEFLHRIFGPLADELMYNQVGSDLLNGIREVQDVVRMDKLSYFKLHFPIQERLCCKEGEKSLFDLIVKKKESN